MELWRNPCEADLPGEEWRTCADGPDYEVSNLGRVRVMTDKYNRNGRHFWVGKIITQSEMPEDKKYLRVTFTVGGVRKSPMPVHRIVGRAFVEGETAERNQINHIDCDKQNNHYTNLEWCTAKENKEHAMKNGLASWLEGEDKKESILKVAQIEEILHRYFYKFEWLRDIGKDFNMKMEYISLVVRGERWNSVFTKFVLDNKEYYDKVAPILRKRNGTNKHKFDQRIKEALLGA